MIRADLAIAADHPAFAGHFPARPVVPGVVLLDASLCAIAEARREDRAGSAPPSIGQVKFLSTVAPGEPVRLEYEGDRLTVFAGPPDAERVAMKGTIRTTRP